MPLKKHPNVLTIVFSVFLLLLVSAMPCAAQSTAYAIALGLDSCPGCFYVGYNNLQYQNSTEAPGVTCTYTPTVNSSPPAGLNTLFDTAATGSTVTCSFSVLPGTYQVNLLYYDWVSTAANQRKFSVALNGTTVASAFDIYASGTQPITKGYSVVVTGSTLSVVLTGTTGNAWVNAISLKQVSAPLFSTSTPITACGTISASGNYTMTPGTVIPVTDNTTCLNVTADNVSIDCKGGGLLGTGNLTSGAFGIAVNTYNATSTLTNFSLSNCSIAGVRFGVRVYMTSNANIHDNVLTGLGSSGQSTTGIFTSDSPNLTVKNNRITDGQITIGATGVGGATGAYVQGNTLVVTDAGVRAALSVGPPMGPAIYMSRVRDTNVANNSISGPSVVSWSDLSNVTYLDSAIAITDTDTTFVSSNTVNGLFFACVEQTGLNYSPHIVYNDCTTTTKWTTSCIWQTYSSPSGRGVAKISGAPFSPLIQGNTCTGYDALVDIKCDSTEPYFQLTDLTVSDNILRNPPDNWTSMLLGDLSAYVGSTACNGVVTVGNNTISNNKLTGLPSTSYNSAPLLYPGTAFIDGGGNYCWASHYSQGAGGTVVSVPAGFPLTCLNYPPNAPVLSYTAATGVVTLQWTLPTSTYPLASFAIHRTGGSGPQTFTVSSPSSTLYRDTTVANGTTYSYTITAVDTNGLVSATSNSVSAQSSGVCAYTGTALHGCYYNDGSFNALGLQQTDPAINFTWGNGSPAAGINNLASGYSVKWLTSPTLSAGTLTFNYTFTGLLGVSVDGNLAFLRTTISPLTATTTVIVGAGSHDIVVQYVPDAGGIGRVSLNWNQ